MKVSLFRYSALIIIFSILLNTNCFSQETSVKDYKILYKFNTIKQADNSRDLEVSFIAQHKKNRKNKIPVFDAEIKFINFLNEKETLLGSVKTNEKGFAKLTLPENQIYLKDENGYLNFKAVFKKTDAIKSYTKKIAVKNLILELDLTEIDSVKTVNLKAFSIDSLGIKKPLKDEIDLIFSIEGMISKMKIEEGTLEDGKYEFEFPTDIPGDVNGKLNVFVIVEDHDDYGNVIQNKYVNWGVFNEEISEKSNTLWSSAAPIWMYIILTILLVGVWSNYIYTIINLFKIKKEGDILKAADNE